MTRYTMPRSPARLRSLQGACVLLALVLMPLLPHLAMAEPLKLGGAGTALKTMELLAAALHSTDPKFSLEIVPNLGTGGGIKALIAGRIDLAVTSRLPTEAEMAQGLIGREYGRTPFILATAHPGVKNLTLEQSANIYAGTQTTWDDGKPI